MREEVNGRGIVRVTSLGLALFEQHKPSPLFRNFLAIPDSLPLTPSTGDHDGPLFGACPKPSSVNLQSKIVPTLRAMGSFCLKGSVVREVDHDNINY
jgi:hypothetical protein